MENFIVIAIVLLIVLFLLRFIFKAAKNILTILMLVIMAVVGLHYFSPETLDKLLSKERHDRWTQEVESRTATAVDKAGKKTQELLDKVDN